MTRGPLIRQGIGPAQAYELARQQRIDDAAELERISRESQHIVEHALTHGTAPGDERKLRGVPVQAKGVAGAMNGTTPHNIRWGRV